MPRVCSRVDPGTARWWKGARAGQRVDRRRSYASSGPGWKIQEVSRVGAQSVTSKSKLLAREMPRVCSGGLRVDPGTARWWKGARAGQRVDRRRSYASSGPGWKIQEVSRVGAQSVTSKSKLLAREMPRVCDSTRRWATRRRATSVRLLAGRAQPGCHRAAGPGNCGWRSQRPAPLPWLASEQPSQRLVRFVPPVSERARPVARFRTAWPFGACVPCGTVVDQDSHDERLLTNPRTGAEQQQ
eukprot:COSAG04_NODE_382_length_15412_cov_4.959992_8_plen_242_part_00